MFRESWRLQRDYLYVDNVHGADWDAVYRMYEPWLEHVGHRADLTYLLDILGGEVAVGHSFAFGGDTPDVDSVSIGLLGADVVVDKGRYRLSRVLTGENWNPGLRLEAQPYHFAIVWNAICIAVLTPSAFDIDRIVDSVFVTVFRRS